MLLSVVTDLGIHCLLKPISPNTLVNKYSEFSDLGPVVQSIISLMSSLVVKMLTLLVSTISNSQIFLLKKNVRLLTFFQQKY